MEKIFILGYISFFTPKTSYFKILNSTLSILQILHLRRGDNLGRMGTVTRSPTCHEERSKNIFPKSTAAEAASHHQKPPPR